MQVQVNEQVINFIINGWANKPIPCLLRICISWVGVRGLAASGPTLCVKQTNGKVTECLIETDGSARETFLGNKGRKNQ